MNVVWSNQSTDRGHRTTLTVSTAPMVGGSSIHIQADLKTGSLHIHSIPGPTSFEACQPEAAPPPYSATADTVKTIPLSAAQEYAVADKLPSTLCFLCHPSEKGAMTGSDIRCSSHKFNANSESKSATATVKTPHVHLNRRILEIPFIIKCCWLTSGCDTLLSEYQGLYGSKLTCVPLSDLHMAGKLLAKAQAYLDKAKVICDRRILKGKKHALCFAEDLRTRNHQLENERRKLQEWAREMNGQPTEGREVRPIRQEKT